MASGSYRSYEISSSSQGRKEVLWNVQEPGDPYDIRKYLLSMIAKLPGGGTFMGSHLEVICLLQAAEIERLTDFLDIYKFRFKDLQRNELDRHSYQIQIKELSQKIADMDVLRTDNQKLKDFLKKQGIQIETLRAALREKNSQELRTSYDKILILHNQLIEQNTQLKNELESMTAKFQSYQRSMVQQIELFKRQWTQENTAGSDSRKKQNQQVLMNFKATVQGELRKLQAEIQRLQQLIELKNQDLSNIRLQNDHLKEEINRLRSQSSTLQKNLISDRSYEQLKSTYQSKIALLSQQLQHKIAIIREDNILYEDLHRKNIELQQVILQHELRLKDSEAKLKNREEEIIKLNELIMKIDREGARASGHSHELQIQSEAQIKELSRQIEHLKSKLRLEVSQERQSREQIERKSLESSSRVQSLTRQNESLKKQLVESTDLKRQIAHLQSQRAMLIQQIQRLNELNNTKNQQLSHLRGLSSENDNLKSRISQIERTLSTRYQSQLSKVRSQYDYKIKEISQLKGNELQSRTAMIEKDLERSKDLLKRKNEEAERHRIASFQWQSKYNQLELDQTYKIRNYESTINTLKKENDQLYQKIKNHNDLGLQLNQFRNKYVLLESQTQQSTMLLRSREEEIANLRHRLVQIEEIYSKNITQANIKISKHAQKILQLNNQNEQLKKKLSDFISNSNNIGKQTVAEINRLNTALKKLEVQKINLDNQNQQLKQQLEHLKLNVITSLNRQKDELRRILTESQAKNRNILVESTANLKNLQFENESLKRQISQFKSSISNYEVELSRRTMNHEAISRENQDLRNKLRDIEGRISHFSLQIQTLNQKHRQKSEEYISLDNKYRNANAELENMRRYIKQYEMTMSTKFDGQISRKSYSYEQTIQKMTKQFDDLRREYVNYQHKYEDLKRKNDSLEKNFEELRRRYSEVENNYEELRRRYTEIEHRYTQLNIEYEKLTFNLKNATQQIQSLRREKNQKEGMLTTFETDINKRINEYQSSIFNMTRSREDLQRKINDSQLLLKQRIEQYNRLEVNFRNINQQLQLSKRRYNDLENLFNQKMEGQVVNKYKLYDRAINDLSNENQELRKKLNEVTNQLNNRIKEVNQLSLLVSENQNLKRRIQNYEASIAAYQTQVNRQFVNYEQRMQNLTKQNQELKRKLIEGTESTRRISLESQDKVTYLTRQFERTASNLKLYERQNGELKRRLTQLGDLGRVVAELQNKLAITSQELERLNANFRSKCDQYNKLDIQQRNLILDLEAARKQKNQLESRLTNTLDNEVPKRYASYEQTILQLRKKINQIQTKNQGLINQVERFSANLRSKSDESTQLVHNFNNLSNQYEQFKRRAKETEAIKDQNLMTLRKENDELRRNLQQSQTGMRQLSNQKERRLVQAQNKIKIMIQQIQRLNQTVTSKNEELERLLRRVKQYELLLAQNKQIEIKNKVAFQNGINSLKRDNEELRRKLQEYGDLHQKVLEYSTHLKMTGQEYEKTTTILKTKSEEYAKLETAYRSLIRENEDLKRKVQELTDFNKRIIEYQQKINLIIQENQKLQMALRAKTDDITSAESRIRQLIAELDHSKRQVVQLERSLTNKYELEASKKASNYQQNLAILTKEREQLHRKKQDYENRIISLTNQIQRLNVMVRTRTEQLQKSLRQTQSLRQNSQRKLITNENQKNTLQSNYMIVVNQLELAKKSLHEYEGKVYKLNGEFDRLKTIINQLQKNRQDLYEKNIILSEEIERLLSENKDLETQTRDVRLRLSDQSSLQKRINEHLSLMVILFAEIQTLRKRVTDKQKEVEHVRRSSLSPHMLKH